MMATGTLSIILASALWGVIHSWLASHGIKAALRRVFTDRFDKIYRLAYNVFALVSILPVLAMLIFFPDSPLYTIPTPWAYLAFLGQGLALVALIAGVMQTGPLEFIGLAQLIARPGDAPAALTTRGLYAYVRHPLYTAGLVFMWLTPAMTVNRLALWAIFSLYFVIGAWFEERKLLRQFGPAYAEYKAQTPMFLPRLRR